MKVWKNFCSRIFFSKLTPLFENNDKLSCKRNILIICFLFFIISLIIPGHGCDFSLNLRISLIFKCSEKISLISLISLILIYYFDILIYIHERFIHRENRRKTCEKTTKIVKNGRSTRCFGLKKVRTVFFFFFFF